MATSSASGNRPLRYTRVPPNTGTGSKNCRRVRRRRSQILALLHAPQILRALVRANEIWLVVLAALIGAITGVIVHFMTATAQFLHVLLLGIDMDQHLSATASVAPLNALLVPSVGGLAFGLFSMGLARIWPHQAVDPIEANALYGGRMSLTDSVKVMLQTIFSNGVGASIGLEAGYTQMGAGIASHLGREFRLRRSELRLVVGCGAAAAIGAGFNAPLTGTFYGFELIIGTYTLGTFAPVAVSSLVAVSVVHALGPPPFELAVELPRLRSEDYVPILAMGAFCAMIAIFIMRGVTLEEGWLRRSGIPAWLRPSIGGLVVGAMALATPMVLSSGHGAIGIAIDTPFPVWWLGLLVVMKACATATSIASGFRGGLFFASLFLGALVGKFVGTALALADTVHIVPPTTLAVVGMSSMATAIVGGPLTMGFLALEATESLPMTIAVLGACVLSSLTVRHAFGYSFATWRFHLRGEAIRSAVDIGWVLNLTVGRIMRRDVRTVRWDTPLEAFRRDFPLGSTQRVLVLDSENRYVGTMMVAEAHAGGFDRRTLSELLHNQKTMLLPQMTIKEAVAMFEKAETDALAVVDAPERRNVIGLLTEQYALRRYNEELDRQLRDLSRE